MYMLCTVQVFLCLCVSVFLSDVPCVKYCCTKQESYSEEELYPGTISVFS